MIRKYISEKIMISILKAMSIYPGVENAFELTPFRIYHHMPPFRGSIPSWYKINLIRDISFPEPRTPKLLKKIGILEISNSFLYDHPYVELDTSMLHKMIPEQRDILIVNVANILDYLVFYSPLRENAIGEHLMRKELDCAAVLETFRLSRHEIEPGMFRE
jgi:hypothetical protein